ncbi:DASH family cryptochrome [Aequorivita viscosa]|uniref:Cryptochrome DASH n=1 Tax=Aequorivita viscosa TaxID=797419 RepID=A0A1M6L5V2_9FLAO|nr:DASH family cryptochrome [Aequorivita viscosa]SDX23015.1 deoxyribodipyrimidine photo-lyase (single-stranded DNA-specific) [Aequorivita viscosa]SHJ66603.1 deoxyribodipyrimidine photo-lyase (single-stranded DNA-specific) [Aequorivita viscosa]
MPEKQKQSTALIWFTKDLRVHDNHSLLKAVNENEKVIGVYCFDPRHFETTEYGFKKTEKFRAKFLIETVENLRKNLQKLNVSLSVYHDKPEVVLPQLVEEYTVETIYSQREWTSEEVAVYKNLQQLLKGCAFIETYDQFLFHPDDIPYNDFSEIPEVFTNFRNKIEANAKVRNCEENPEVKQENNLIENRTKIPTLNDLGLEDFEIDPRSAFPFSGGEDAALQRLQEYFWETKNLEEYKETRNGLLGTDYSSKFSAWLANGSVSPRFIYEEVKRFEKEIVANQSTYWLIFELLWRDYFKYVSLKHGSKIFQLKGISQKNLEWNSDPSILKKWIEGDLEEPFVNANMKEIAATGFMSNRGRQNVNSFWAKELLQDWRIGAAYFESMLVDYDVHSNWGNWMYNSGVGNDPRDRKFNIKKQAERYDADGTYQKTWKK